MKPETLIRNNVTITGSKGSPVIFAHGLGLEQSTWRLVAPAFEKTHKVVLFDHAGCGKSVVDDPEKYRSLDAYAEDLNALASELDSADITLVCHSISSMIGLIAAVKTPALYKQLVFIAPSPRYLNDVDGYIGGHKKGDINKIIQQIETDYAGWVRTAMPSIVHESNSREHIKEVIDSFIATDRESLRRFALATFFADYRAELLKVDKPCLIIQTADDIMSPLGVGDYMHAHIRNSSLVRLRSRGHFPQLTGAKELVLTLREFIDGGG